MKPFLGVLAFPKETGFSEKKKRRCPQKTPAWKILDNVVHELSSSVQKIGELMCMTWGEGTVIS